MNRAKKRRVTSDTTVSSYGDDCLSRLTGVRGRPAYADIANGWPETCAVIGCTTIGGTMFRGETMNDMTLLIAAGIWILCGIGAYLITAQKGRDDAGSSAVMGVLLGPIGLVMAATAKAPSGPAATCVHCGKTVAQDRARLCNHCGEPFA